MNPEEHRTTRWRSLVGYGLMLAGTAAVYQLIVRRFGDRLVAPPPAAGQDALFGHAAAGATADALLHVLLALVVVILVARGVGSLFRYLQQPPVVGEVIAGILLGPSLLGRVAPGLAHQILPNSVAPFLGILSQVGAILYMFLVGVELDPALLRKRGHAAVAISHASIIVPFLLGSTFALFLYPRLSTSDVPFYCFALFIGVSMSVTAFPVLARILTDRRIHTTRMGVLALTCAAVDDVTAWCLLAFVVSVVQARLAGALLTAALAAGFIALIVLVARPGMVRLARFADRRGRVTQGVMAIVFVALLLSSLMTDSIGIHAVFGAFALGAVIPHDSRLARELTDRLEDLVVVLLLPAFFAFTGMRTHIGLVSGLGNWLICGAVVVIASAGKFGGSFVAARLSGLGWRDSSALGVLMNTRGLMELIVLNIGLELRVISPTLFAMLVLMAVATTFMTTPVLHLITRNRPVDQAPGASPPTPAVQPGPRPTPERGVLVPLSNPANVTALVDLAVAATRDGDPPPRVLALVPRPAGGVRSGLREVDRKESPAAPVLMQAADHARTLGAIIDPQALWSDDPVADIAQIAREPQIRWLLLGGAPADPSRDRWMGVERQILDRVSHLSLNVGIVVGRPAAALGQVLAVADASPDGTAALDFAARVARRRELPLHALLVPRAAAEPEAELQAAVKQAARAAGRWLYTDVLVDRTASQLAAKIQGPLVVVGRQLALDLRLVDQAAGPGCSFVLVHGGAERAAGTSGQRSAILRPTG